MRSKESEESASGITSPKSNTTSPSGVELVSNPLNERDIEDQATQGTGTSVRFDSSINISVGSPTSLMDVDLDGIGSNVRFDSSKDGPDLDGLDDGSPGTQDITRDCKLSTPLLMILSLAPFMYTYGAIRQAQTGNKWYEYAFSTIGPMAAPSVFANMLGNPRKPGFPISEFIVFLNFPLAHGIKFAAKLAYWDKWYGMKAHELYAFDDLLYGCLWFFFFKHAFLPLRQAFASFDNEKLEKHIPFMNRCLLGTLAPIIFLTFEVQDCLWRHFSNDDVVDGINAEDICKGLAVPNFIIMTHVAAIAFYQIFFSPLLLAEYGGMSSFMEKVMMFKLPLTLRIQVICFGFACLDAVFLFGNREENKPVVLTAWIAAGCLTCWAVIFISELIASVWKDRVQNVLNSVSSVPRVSSNEGEENDSRSVGEVLFDAINLTKRKFNAFLNRFSTERKGELALIFRLILMLPPLGTLISYFMYVVRGPWWWVLGKIGGPLGVICTAVHFVCAPSKPLGREEIFSYGCILGSFAFSTIGPLIWHDVGIGHVIANFAQTSFLFACFFECRRCRKRIAENAGASYVPSVVIPVAIAGIGPILFITAEPLACFSSHAEFDNILDACEGIINPSFTAQVHMICFVCFILFYYDYTSSKISVRKLVQFKICHMHKLIGCFFGLASFLMFAALTMKKEGRQSDASKGVEWLVMLCWFVIMITQLFCTTVLKGKWRHHMLAEIPDEEENTVLSTNSRMQIAPVYTYLLSTFALLEIVLATTFIIEGPWCSISQERFYRFDVPFVTKTQLLMFFVATCLAMFAYSTGHFGPLLGKLDVFSLVCICWQYIFVSQFIVKRFKLKVDSNPERDEKNRKELEEERAQMMKANIEESVGDLVFNMAGDGKGVGIGGLGGLS